MESVEYINHTFIFKKSIKGLFKIGLNVFSFFSAIHSVSLMLDGIIMNIWLPLGFVLAFGAWYLGQSIDGRKRVPSIATEILEEMEEGVRLVLPEIDRGDGVGVHKELTIYDRDRTDAVNYHAGTDAFLISGAPCMKLISPEETITMDFRQNNRKYVSMMYCKEGCRQQMYDILHRGLGMQIEEISELPEYVS